MKTETKELLEQVTQIKLKDVIAGGEQADSSFKEGMEAAGKLTEIEKNENSKKGDLIKNIITAVGIATTLVIPVIDVCCKATYARGICKWEEAGHTPTTSAGKGLTRYLSI